MNTWWNGAKAGKQMFGLGEEEQGDWCVWGSVRRLGVKALQGLRGYSGDLGIYSKCGRDY